MIRINDLSKHYGSLKAVDGLDIRISEGEYFGLLGPNGAGKTTTIKMISSLTPMTCGNIEINGIGIDRNQTKLKSQIGVVPQHNNLENEMTVWENMELHGRLYGIDRKTRESRINELLGFAGLEERKDTLSKNLSGGMKRRLLIARALIHKPKVLLLDEPSVGLDPEVRKSIWDLIKGLKKDGITLILTTHYIEEAEAICDKVALMDKGKLVEIGVPSELIIKVGKVAIDNFDNNITTTSLFSSREEAMEYAGNLNGSINIRPTNLEDVFLKYTSRRMNK